MTTLAIHRDQGRTRSGAGLPMRCGPCRASGADHHQSHARHSSRAPTGRRFAVGRFFSSIGEALEFEALRRAGLSAEVALANLCQPAGGLAVQALPDLPETHLIKSLSSAAADEATQPREALNAVPDFQASGTSHDS